MRLTLSGTISVQFSQSVVSDSLWPHGLQHTRLPCLSPTPGVYSNSCTLNQWCCPTISSSVVPSSSCLQSVPASGSFPMGQLFTSGGQSFRFSISPSNEYSGLISFRMDWLDLFVVQGILKRFLPTPHQERRKREDLLRELDWKQGVAVINSTLSDQLCNFKQVI